MSPLPSLSVAVSVFARHVHVDRGVLAVGVVVADARVVVAVVYAAVAGGGAVVVAAVVVVVFGVPVIAVTVTVVVSVASWSMQLSS